MQSWPLRLKRKFSNIKISNGLISNALNHFQPQITEFQLQRFGGTGDGSYLVPGDLDGIDNCISFGCGSDTKFEDDLGNYIESNFTIFDELENLPINYKYLIIPLLQDGSESLSNRRVLQLLFSLLTLQLNTPLSSNSLTQYLK
jgi:hypothetical protein